MEIETTLCDRDPRHAKRQKRGATLKVIAPLAPLYDFEWTVYNEAIVGPEIVELFEKENVTGVKFRRVIPYLTTGDQFSREMYEMYVVGDGGNAPESSGIRPIEICPHCGFCIFTGYQNTNDVFNIDEWDGSDIFTIWPLPRFIVASDSVIELLDRESITGVAAVSLSKLPVCLSGTLTPGHREDYRM